MAVPTDADVVFERFSDSAGSYVVLDTNNPAIYKQLYRAAKAKLKLRIKATVLQRPTSQIPNIMDEEQTRIEPLSLPTPPTSSPTARHSYLETVLSTPREQGNSARRTESSPTPALSTFDQQPVSAVMSLDNATNSTLAPSIKPEQQKKDKAPKVAISANGIVRSPDTLGGVFCIDCNNCEKSIPDEHYHCGICDDGDFDLCSSCVAADATCNGEGHWLIKRRIQAGNLVTSITETIAPKKWQAETKAVDAETEKMTTTQYAPRTCNSCINGKQMRFCGCCTSTDV